MAKLRQPTMSLPAVLSAWSRRTAIAILAFVLMVFSFVAPAEAVTPTSGPTSGGTSVTIEGIHFVQVVAGDAHSLGLTSEGTVFAWGLNGDGQLGVGSNLNSSIPRQVKGLGGSGFLTGVTEIAAGGSHSLALSSAGVFAWGYNDMGQLGNGSDTASSTPVQVKGVGGSEALAGITSISAKGDFSIALSPDGIFAWGDNAFGQLGDSTTTNRWTPVQVKGEGGSGFLTEATSISAGRYFVLAISPAGVFAWGLNDCGQLGDGSDTTSSTPVRVKGVGGNGFLAGVTSISSGGSHSLAVSPAGVFAWGLNLSGQLGDGTTTNQWTPVQVRDVAGSGYLSEVSSISLGEYHSLAVSSAGVFAWGLNFFGQLGNGSFTNSSTPVQVQAAGAVVLPAAVTGVAAGSHYSLAFTAHQVYAWGYNIHGQLGNGSATFLEDLVLGANIVHTGVNFGTLPATSWSQSVANVTAVSPSGQAGTAQIQGSANLFGGTTPASPASVGWDAGMFTYVAPTPTPTASSTPSSTSTQIGSPAPTPNSAALGSTPLAVTGVSDVGTFLLLAILSILGGLVAFIGRKRTRYSVRDKSQS